MPTCKDNMIHDYPRATRLYASLIKLATKCADNEIGAIESLMRDRFRTLDNLPRSEFMREARRACAVLQAMAGEEA